jgi:hypothetical protein
VQREAKAEEGRPGAAEHIIITEKGPRTFSEGDRVIFLENNKALDVKNGSLGTVMKIDNKSPEKSFLVKLDNEKMVSFDPQQYRNFDYGYAMTVHKSQGTTVDRSFVLATKRFDKHVTYVSMSRHRDDVTLYYGKNDFKNREALITAAEKRNEKSLVQDFAKNRGYETLEPKFRKTMLFNKEHLEVPKGELQEPIKGYYHGDITHEGKNYHRIYDIHNNRDYLVPATEKGVNQRLSLRDVEYDGLDVTKPHEKEEKALLKTKIPGIKEITLSGTEYMEVPKGELKEPIVGNYSGDVQYQGKNYHRIEPMKDDWTYLVPATEKGVDRQLHLREVEYDGKSVSRAPEKERITVGVFKKTVHARMENIDKQLQNETDKEKRKDLAKERQGLSRLTTSMSNIKTKDLEKTIVVAKTKTPQDLQRQIPGIEQQIKQIKTLEKDLGRGLER